MASRRLTDVLLTLVPLLLAGVVTLELRVLDGIALNSANIIALPLLLGVRDHCHSLTSFRANLRSFVSPTHRGDTYSLTSGSEG